MTSMPLLMACYSLIAGWSNVGSRAVASATSTASAVENIRVSALSERLVSITGTFAPMTMPAPCASLMNDSSLYIMLPASMSGAIRMSAWPATGDFDPLDPRRLRVDGDVEIERPIDDAARDLITVGHLCQRRGLHRRWHLRPYHLDRREDRHLRRIDPDGAGEDDRVLDDVLLLIDVREQC